MDPYTSTSSLSSARPPLTERSSYISRHPVTQTALLHSSDNFISPVWASVTATPWDAKAKLLSGGYGSPMHRTKISDECPAFFFNPHKEYNYDFTASRPSFTQTMAKKSERGSESCFVLPGGESVLEATLKSQKAHSNGHKSFRILNYDGKRAMMMNIPPPTQRDLPPINWNTSRQSTARDNTQLNTNNNHGFSSARHTSRPETSAAAVAIGGRLPSSRRSMQEAGTAAITSHRHR